ncbi:hypothetical protein AB0H58_02280 [Nocardia neocaledoniensis]|uniref:hypothetical protein n=1 Tax=Nocardia neocaledoniensis TaxID=236511 RepID=UPI00340FD168
MRPENVRSTATLFDLPMYGHYGIGGLAFGAWRDSPRTMYTGQWLVAELFGDGRDERAARLRAYAAGRAPTGIPETAAAILTRDAPVAVAMTEFFDLLRDETRRTPYPAEL